MKTTTRKKTKRNRVTYFTRRHLLDCAKRAGEWDFNRQLSADVAELPDSRFPVLETLNHSHRHGVPCEPHVRCVVLLRPGRYLIVDVPCQFFAALPSRRLKA